jgi:hypothetical protein
MLCPRCGVRTETDPCAACGSAALVAGRFRLDSELATDRASKSYRATDATNGDVVVVHVVDRTVAREPVKATEPQAAPLPVPGEAELEQLRQQIELGRARQPAHAVGRRVPVAPSASDRQDYARVIAIGVAAWGGLALSAWLAFGENPPEVTPSVEASPAVAGP